MDDSPCQNGGQCVYNETLRRMDCVCPSGFKGLRCEQGEISVNTHSHYLSHISSNFAESSDAKIIIGYIRYVHEYSLLHIIIVSLD